MTLMSSVIDSPIRSSTSKLFKTLHYLDKIDIPLTIHAVDDSIF